MRFQALAGALVVSLVTSGLALAGTRAGDGARPDLTVSSVSTQEGAVVFLGSSFQVRDRTRNIGSASARATVTQYYLSANGHRTAVGRRSLARLRSHRSSTGSATARAPVTLGLGTYSLVACADGAKAVRETNERNNCRTAATKVIVKKPPPPV
jgi:subtilase family serine protease